MSDAGSVHSEADSPLIVDHVLATRLERTEAIANSRFVDGRKRSQADSAAAWIEVAGARAMFDGPDSPCTQTFGLGLAGDPTEEDFAELESFFQVRGAPVQHEVAPLISSELIRALSERRYVPLEFTNVLCRRIGGNVALPTASNPRIEVAAATAAESELWARTSASGWSETLEFQQFVYEFAKIYPATEGCCAVFARLAGNPIATGVVAIAEGVALLSGASTLPKERKYGAQSALLTHRLQYAVDRGCDLAMMCALPGSPSQRNAQRNGFQIAYTRIKWMRLARH